MYWAFHTSVCPWWELSNGWRRTPPRLHFGTALYKEPSLPWPYSLLQLFHANVHSWYHSQAGNDGSWLITAAVSACPQLCVTLPLILHIFALLICACSGKFYLSPLAPILHAFSLPPHLIVSYCSSCIIIHRRDTNLPIKSTPSQLLGTEQTLIVWNKTINAFIAKKWDQCEGDKIVISGLRTADLPQLCSP